MNINSGYILIIVIFTNLYVCFGGYALLRSLISGIANKKYYYNALKIYFFLFIQFAGFYFYLRYASGGLRSLFGLASSYWVLLLFVPFFLLADILSFGSSVFCYARKALFPKSPAVSAGRIAIFKRWVRIISLVLAFAAIALGSYSARYAKITKYSVSVEKPMPGKGLRVAMFSDTHIGSMVGKKQMARLVEKVNSLEADLVFIVGDIVDRTLDVYKNENINEELRMLKAPMGVYAVPGNHDYFARNIEELKELLSGGNVKLLADETVLVDNAFYLVGRKDFSSGRWGDALKPLNELTAELDASLPLILLQHQPLNLGETEKAGIDLQVSGHTHQGQIWPARFFTKRIYENDYGLLYKGKSAIVVTSGYGTWGPPLRIGTRAEIVCIDLVSSDNKK